MAFDWLEFLHIARLLAEDTPNERDREASLRSAVSRAYYASFGCARSHASSALGFAPSADASDHRRLTECFRRLGERHIAFQLGELRRWRNACDYADDLTSRPGLPDLPTLAADAIRYSQDVIERLVRARPIEMAAPTPSQPHLRLYTMPSLPLFVQIGAGNIGRSFLGQLFSRGGYQVTFIDVDDAVINALNERGEYRVEIRDVRPETIVIENVRGVNGKDVAAAVEALVHCELCATSVGQGALRFIYPTLAEAIRVRCERGLPPLDIIIAENIRDGAEAFHAGLTALLPDDFDLAAAAGLIETSIGKMVPIMSAEDRASDPLLVFAEAYNTLICDARGFRNAVPTIPGLDAKQNIKAYVDRKSFIHNLGHALLAYFAYVEAPELMYTWEAVEHPAIGEATRRGMWESGRALVRKYPDEFTEENQGAHIEDILSRFANRALGDTIFRVGRDITRKLSREDRVIGALLCDLQQGIEPRYTALCAAAGMRFQAVDENGAVFPGDAKFAAEVWPLGVEHIVDTVCGLAADAAARATVIAADARLRQAQAEGVALLP